MKNLKQDTARKNRIGEFFRAVGIASRYFLSHHEKSELYKCYHLGGHAYVCSRCMGIYAGIIAGFLSYSFFMPDYLIMLSAVVFLPAFALLDWLATALRLYKSHNLIRTFSGLLLGFAYFFGLILFFVGFPDFRVILVAIVYGLIALALIIMLKKKSYSYSKVH